jgi:hypothetical protein
MGAAAAVPAVLGLGGLLMQNESNRKAQKSQDKLTGKQSDLIKRQTMLFDSLRDIVMGADKAGQFDPTRRLEQLQADTEYYAGRDIGNTAGAARTLGYRPGDTAPLKQIRSIDSAYKLNYAQEAAKIRQSAFTDKLSAFRSIDPSALNPGIQTYGQQAQVAGSQQQPLSGLVGAIQPFLGSQKGPSVNTGVPSQWQFLKDLRF